MRKLQAKLEATASRAITAVLRTAARTWWDRCGVAVAGLCTAACGAWAAGLTPTLGIGARFDDLRFPGAAPEDHYLGTLAPRIAFEAGDQTIRFGLEAQQRLAYLYQPRLLPAAPALSVFRDGDDARLRAGGDWGDDASLRLAGRFRRTVDPFDVEDRSFVTTGPVTRWAGWTSARLGPLEGGYAADGSDVERGATREAHSLDWNIAALPWRAGHSAFLLEWRQRQLEVGGATALRSHLAMLGFRRAFSPGLSGEIEAGLADIIFGDGTRERAPACALELNGPWMDFGTTRARLRLARDARTTVTAALERPLGDGRLGARYESTTSADGASGNDASRTQLAAFSAQDTLGRSTVLGVESSWSQSQPLRLEGATRELVRGSVWMVRRVRPWLDLKCAWSYLRQIRAASEADAGLRRVRVDAGVSVRWPS